MRTKQKKRKVKPQVIVIRIFRVQAGEKFRNGISPKDWANNQIG